MEEAFRMFAERARPCRRSWWPGARSGTRGWWGSPPGASPRSCTGRRCSCRSRRTAPTGSGRSMPGIELHGFLVPWKERMVRFGGHAQAVGLTVRLDVLEELRREWEAAGAAWPAELLARRYEYELELPPRRLTGKLVAQLGRLEPYGMGIPGLWCAPGRSARRSAPALRQRPSLGPRARQTTAPPSTSSAGAGRSAPRISPGRFEALGWIEHDDYRGGPCLRLLDSRPGRD